MATQSKNQKVQKTILYLKDQLLYFRDLKRKYKLLEIDLKIEGMTLSGSNVLEQINLRISRIEANLKTLLNEYLSTDYKPIERFGSFDLKYNYLPIFKVGSEEICNEAIDITTCEIKSLSEFEPEEVES